MNGRDPELEKTLWQIRKKGDRDVASVGVLRAVWPLSMGFLGMAVAVTIMLAMVPDVPPWRWVLQGGFITLGVLGSWLGWHLRHP